jgi:hypothetical protein
MAIKKKVGDPVPKKRGRDPIKGPRTLPQVTVSASRIVDEPVKKPVSKRALMDVNLTKGYKMSIDTTNMKNPDKDTYNYIIKDASGKVTSKGNIATSESKFGANQLVQKLKAKK